MNNTEKTDCSVANRQLPPNGMSGTSANGRRLTTQCEKAAGLLASYVPLCMNDICKLKWDNYCFERRTLSVVTWDGHYVKSDSRKVAALITMQYARFTKWFGRVPKLGDFIFFDDDGNELCYVKAQRFLRRPRS